MQKRLSLVKLPLLELWNSTLPHTEKRYHTFWLCDDCTLCVWCGRGERLSGAAFSINRESFPEPTWTGKWTHDRSPMYSSGQEKWFVSNTNFLFGLYFCASCKTSPIVQNKNMRVPNRVNLKCTSASRRLFEQMRSLSRRFWMCGTRARCIKLFEKPSYCLKSGDVTWGEKHVLE